MPYITQEQRLELLDWRAPENAGELNYEITKLLNAYVTHKQPRYQTFNDAMGALEGAKLEFYRRVVAPYENQKAHENGDLYESNLSS